MPLGIGNAGVKAAAAGSGTISSSTAGYVAFYSGATTLAGDAGMRYDSGTDTLTLAGNLSAAGGVITGARFDLGSALMMVGSGFRMDDTLQYRFYNGGTGGTAISGLAAISNSPIITITDGASGVGDYQAKGSLLTAGTATATKEAVVRKVITRYDWTNAMVVALGAALTGDVTVATLPAKTVVTNAYIVITGTAAGVATLTVACGRTGAGYIDYIVASDAKVAANTVYGDASGERGTNLTGYDLPSFTGTTAVKIHFVSTVQNLDQTTGSTGSVYLETMTLP